ncbi:MAG: hypothetical protein ABIH00_08665 [Armatimonadota bacterium]
MKKLLVLFVLIIFLSAAAFAASTDTQTIYYEIDAINEISFDTNITMTVNTATAGSQPTEVDVNDLEYNITTNETGKKLTGQLNANMPDNTTLKVNVDGGEVALSTTANNLYTNISTMVTTGNWYYSFAFRATVAAGLPADGHRIVTFTLCDE